jgi:type 2 lantibiotic biosynthesis protein LanM
MSLHLAEELAWYRATTLVERLAAGRPSGDPAPAEEDELARYRLQSWKSQSPFDDESYFEQRLALDRLTEAQLRQLIVERIEAVRERFPERPAWLSELRAAFSRPCASCFCDLIPDRLKNRPTTGFLDAAAPFIEQALDRLDEGIAALTTVASPLPFDPSTVKKLLFADLPDEMIKMLSRTMTLELNIARLEGELEGDTPEERFRNFLERLRQPDYLRSFLRDYPVLARSLVEQTQRWVAVSLEFIERLCRDWAEIKAAFTPEADPGLLVAVAGGLADTHRGGRSVIIAKFSSGLRLVYKPKSLAVDAHFQELLRWLNALGAEPSLRTLRVLDRGSYGWMEYAAARECETAEEVRRFYRRQGSYLALLYLLDATDFHSGNLIACGEHPLLIDLEALFHPRRSASGDSDSADKIARDTVSYSVLRIGLLPERVWGNAECEGVDMSGLGTVDGQLTPHALPQWEETGTDAMHLVRKRKPIRADKNRPKLAARKVNALDYQEEILEGFASTYSLLLKHRDELLAGDGPLARFAEDEVCVFLRSARTYRRLLRESYHPDVLRDALDRDRLFDLLWVEVEDDQDLAQVIRIERDELWRGDIPLFITRPDSRDLWINESERIPDFFPESSLSVVQRSVKRLSAEDHSRQAWFIRASLATLGADDAGWQSSPATAPCPVANGERLRSAAQAVGDRLEALALRGQDDASWIGLMLEQDRSWEIERFGMDLSDGLPGVALFLAYLGAATGQTTGQTTGQKRYTALSQAALTAFQRQIEKRGDDVELIGGFDGWGGAIYALVHLGVHWDRPDLIAEAESVVDRLPDLIEQDEALDVFGGAAGCIAALRGLYHCAPSDRVLAAAIQCGDHLLARAQQMPEGIGWLTVTGASRPLAGFAHGAAGIAWSLLKLYAWTGLERFQTAAREALAYERSLFVEAAGNWPDLREHRAAEGQPSFMTAWCHGAAGIGLARLNSLPHADDPAVRAEIATALETTLKHGFGHNHSLCHGDAGNLELLLQASRVLGDHKCEAHIQRLAAAMLESIEQDGEQHGWQCGTPYTVETPGLMTGLAGIGLQLLRLADPELAPSVLVLEPPHPKLPFIH